MNDIGKDAQSQQGNIELLDSPGIIPARQSDQNGAINLAICNDIGEASYDRIAVSIALCDKLNHLYTIQPSYVDMDKIICRYKIPFNKLNGEEILYHVANNYFSENQVLAADKLLSDFRNGFYGYSSLEAPPIVDGIDFIEKKILNNYDSVNNYSINNNNNNFDGW
jgi:ribosome biogenesis GTPase A